MWSLFCFISFSSSRFCSDLNTLYSRWILQSISLAEVGSILCGSDGGISSWTWLCMQIRDAKWGRTKREEKLVYYLRNMKHIRSDSPFSHFIFLKSNFSDLTEFIFFSVCTSEKSRVKVTVSNLYLKTPSFAIDMGW